MRLTWVTGWCKKPGVWDVQPKQYTLDHGPGVLNLTLVTNRAHIENKASIKVLEKIGMDFFGEGIVGDCPVRTHTKASSPVILKILLKQKK